jgi:hypothetical protein
MADVGFLPDLSVDGFGEEGGEPSLISNRWHLVLIHVQMYAVFAE